jgi:hypothetical protein
MNIRAMIKLIKDVLQPAGSSLQRHLAGSCTTTSAGDLTLSYIHAGTLCKLTHLNFKMALTLLTANTDNRSITFKTLNQAVQVI